MYRIRNCLCGYDVWLYVYEPLRSSNLTLLERLAFIYMCACMNVTYLHLCTYSAPVAVEFTLVDFCFLF